MGRERVREEEVGGGENKYVYYGNSLEVGAQ